MVKITIFTGQSFIYFYGLCSTEHPFSRAPSMRFTERFSSAGTAGSCAQRPSGRHDAGCRAGQHGTSVSPAGRQTVCPAGNGRVINLRYSIFGNEWKRKNVALHTERAFKLWEQKARHYWIMNVTCDLLVPQALGSCNCLFLRA